MKYGEYRSSYHPYLEYQILDDEQCKFRAQLLLTSNNKEKQRKEHRHIHLPLVDLEKAYDGLPVSEIGQELEN